MKKWKCKGCGHKEEMSIEDLEREKDEALKAYIEAEAPARKAYARAEAPAWKAYKEAKARLEAAKKEAKR